MLDRLSEKWSLLEMKHRTSKSATDDFWDMAKNMFPKLHRARMNEMNSRNVPKFQWQRRKLHKQEVPPITLKTAFMHKETKEVTVVEGDKTPLRRFNPRIYTKLYEVATMEVIINSFIYVNRCMLLEPSTFEILRIRIKKYFIC